MSPCGESGAAGCVMLVEDDPDIRDLFSDFIRDAGYGVLAIADGRQALEKLRAGARPCVILLDLMMPVMDGWTFRRAQLEDEALTTVPTVLFTGVANPQKEAEALQADGFLLKTADRGVILSLIERYCRN